MPKREIDLQDPEQLAALLNATLPDEDNQAGDLLEQLDTLVASDNPVFAHVGRAPDGVSTSDDQPDEALDDSAGVGPDDEGLDDEGLDDNAGVGPDDDEPTAKPTGLGSTSSPVRAGKQLWTDIDRRKARTKYTLYELEATHTRREPIESGFTGHCQSVRVSLPMTPVASDSYIGTFIGKVEASDHLLFSVEAVREFYERTFGKAPKLERVDLITGARFLGRRFSPVSVYLGYSQAEHSDLPCFYILEGGSASGQPKALYAAKDMSAAIHQKAGFSFTPLTCSNNWYQGGLEMRADMREPVRVFLTAAQERDGSFDYLDLSVRYAVSTKRRVIAPFELQVEAAMRVLAISEQIGCELGQGRGGGLQPVLGPVAEALMPWNIKPRGSASPAERERYCGCPKASSTAVDSTPPTGGGATPSSDPAGKPSSAAPASPAAPGKARASAKTQAASSKPPARKTKRKP